MRLEELTYQCRISDTQRHKEYVLLAVEKHPSVILLTLKDVKTGEISERQPVSLQNLEQRFTLVETGPFQAESNIVKLVAEGRRLEHAYLFNPIFATETSLIDALPHQLIAVYDHLLPKTRLRFLLADDAGAGKTIIAGLYIREMLLRKLIKRVLIVPPAGLVGNWQAELQKLFRLPFQVIRGSDVKDENPFLQSSKDLAIISVDTLWRDRMKDFYKDAPPYDLVVFDEAHKLTAYKEPDLTIHKSNRYEMAELIAEQGRHLLLMSATPHSGKIEPYFYLWKLLEPTILSTFSMFQRIPPNFKDDHLLRRVKEEMIDFQGQRIFPNRESKTVSYSLTSAERSLYDAVTSYFDEMYDKAKLSSGNATRLAMAVLQRRLASSTWAIVCSLKRRRDKLRGFIEEWKAGILSEQDFRATQAKLPLEDYRETHTGDEEELLFEDGEYVEEGESQERLELGATPARTLRDLELELAEVEHLATAAEAVYRRKHESKFEKLWDALQEHAGQNVLIFTEHKDTLDFLVDRLEGKGFSDQITSIHGGVNYSERLERVNRFNSGAAKYMLATDAAGEGLNMQEACWILVNYDIPWNPSRLEQRMGRIHRYKQRHNVLILNLVADETREGKVLKILLEKLENIRDELGDKVFDVIGKQFQNASLSDLIMKAGLEKKEQEVEGEIESLLDRERMAATLHEQRQRVESQDIKALLEGWQRRQHETELLRIMPAFIRYYFKEAAQYAGLEIEGDLETVFHFKARPEYLRQAMLTYPERLHNQLTFDKQVALPGHSASLQAIFLHPGEAVFDKISKQFLARYSQDAQTGGIFFDDRTTQPYLFYLTRISLGISLGINPQAESESRLKPAISDQQGTSASLSFEPGVLNPRTIEECVIGVKKTLDGDIQEVAAHLLLDLTPAEQTAAHIPDEILTLAEETQDIETFVRTQKGETVRERALNEIDDKYSEREQRITESFNLLEVELLEQREKLQDALQKAIPAAKSKLDRCEGELDDIKQRKHEALQALLTEPDTLELSSVAILARALVMPMTDENDRKVRNDVIEQIAVDVVTRYETGLGAECEDVSNPMLRKGFDLLSKRPNGEERFIEIKGRAREGSVELTENEWKQAANHRQKYYLYVVYHCAGEPQLYINKDPFGRLLATPKGGVIIGSQDIINNARND